MRYYQIVSPTGLDALTLRTGDDPQPGPDDVLVEMRAWSLNYRDLSMPHGGYVRNEKSPLIPLSDGAGEVIAIGENVREFSVGDHVAGCFFQDWQNGELTERQIGSALGGAIDGVLRERMVFPETGLVRVPEHLTLPEAACLPCAAVTAWQALTLADLKPGQTVLMLGTGGVSIFALQLAHAAGARTIITSSSDEKLQRAKELGADVTINYRETPDWQHAVRDATDGVGVDNVVEVGGAGTLSRSLAAARVSGTVSLIGVLTGRPDENPSPLPILFNRLTVRGIYVGSRQMFRDLNAALRQSDIHPVIDRTFGFEDVVAAYQYLQSGQHLGKVVITRE